MAAYQKRNGFMIFSQLGFSLVLLTFLGIVLKPFFPDGWVEQLATLMRTDFDTLAHLAVVGLGVLGCFGLGLCSISILFYD